MELRQINATDNFEEIGGIYVKSWRAAYAGIVPDAYLASLTADGWADALAKGTYASFVLVEEGRYIGVSSISPARDEHLRGWGELASIYLLPEYVGAGCGKLLFDHSVRALRQAGFTKLYLWVLEENLRARRFYEKQGFSPSDETGSIDIGGKMLAELRYIAHLPQYTHTDT